MGDIPGFEAVMLPPVTFPGYRTRKSLHDGHDALAKALSFPLGGQHLALQCRVEKEQQSGG